MLGYVARNILNSKWQTLTWASIFIILFCSVFYISEYKPTYEVVIPGEYSGEVRLLVSRGQGSNFVINKYGIGYIDRKTFDGGFYPKIIRGDRDITKQVKEYGKGALATTAEDIYSYEYLSFFVGGSGHVAEEKGIEELIKINAIDTGYLYRR